MRRVGDTGFLDSGPAISTLDDPDIGVPPRIGVRLLLDLLSLAGQVPHVLVRPFRSGRPARV